MRQISNRLVNKFGTVNKKKYVFMFGAPGVGKGTFAQKMAEDLKLN